MVEELTIDICNEYQHRGKELPKDNPLFTNERNDLVMELKQRCGIPEIWAFNIVNGYHVKDYLAIIEFNKKDHNNKKDNKNDKAYLEWLAEKVEKEQLEKLINQERIYQIVKDFVKDCIYNNKS